MKRRQMKAPWMKFDAVSWLASTAIGSMTPEQEGGYIHLLAHAWVQEPPCTLPVDDAQLAQLSRLGARWKNKGALVQRQFEVVEIEGVGPRLRNARQWAEYCDVIARAERRSKAGKLGAQSRWDSDDHDHNDDDAADRDAGEQPPEPNSKADGNAIADASTLDGETMAMPSPLPSPLASTMASQDGKRLRRTTSRRIRDGGEAADAKVIPMQNWPARFASAWPHGYLDPGMVGKQLSPLVKAEGEAVIEAAWNRFVASDKAVYQIGFFRRNWKTFTDERSDGVHMKAKAMHRLLKENGLLSADGERYQREIATLAHGGPISVQDYIRVGSRLRALQNARTDEEAVRVIVDALTAQAIGGVA